MENESPELEKNFDWLYYVIGLVTGAFIGLVLSVGAIYILVGAFLGLLSGGGFKYAVAKSRENEQ